MNTAWPHGDPRAVVRAILADGRFRSAAPVRPSRPSWLDILWLRFTTFARALLHEIDHLNGILFIDRISRLKRELVLRKIKKLQKTGEW